MAKQIKILVISVASIVFLTIVGIFGFNMMKPNGSKLDDAIAAQKHKASNQDPNNIKVDEKDIIISDEKPVDAESTKIPAPVKKDLTKDSFYEIDEKVKDLDGFSAEEVKEAVTFATNYSTLAMTNHYFIGGDWAKDGFKTNEVVEFASIWYSPEIIKTLGKIDKFEGQEYRDEVLPIVTYFTGIDNPSIDVSPKCSVEAYEKTLDSGCLVSPLKFSDIEYYSQKQKDGHYVLKVKFDAQFDLAVVIRDGNKNAKTTVENKYILTIDKTNRSDGQNSYMISGYDTKYNFSKVSETE